MNHLMTETELKEFNKKMALNKVNSVDTVIGTADAGLMGGIFGMFTNESSKLFLEHTGHFFLFPLAMAASITRTALAWREAYLSKKRGAVVRASVETVAAAGISVAVVGGIVAAGIFGAISPIIFTAVLSFKTAFHAVSSIYNLSKAAVSTGDDKVKYQSRAKAHAIGTVAGGLFTAAVTTVMILAKPALAFIGIIGSVFSIISGIAKGIKEYKEAKKLKAEALQAEAPEYVSSSNTIARSLGHTPEATPTQVNVAKQDFSRSASRKIFDKARVLQNDVSEPLLQRSYSM